MAIYKEIDDTEIKNRTTRNLDTQTSTDISQILANFVTYFKAAEL